MLADLNYFGTTPGDGQITLGQTQPPPGVPVLETRTNQLPHRGILADVENIGALLSLMLKQGAIG